MLHKFHLKWETNKTKKSLFIYLFIVYQVCRRLCESITLKCHIRLYLCRQFVFRTERVTEKNQICTNRSRSQTGRKSFRHKTTCSTSWCFFATFVIIYPLRFCSCNSFFIFFLQAWRKRNKMIKYKTSQNQIKVHPGANSDVPPVRSLKTAARK